MAAAAHDRPEVAAARVETQHKELLCVLEVCWPVASCCLLPLCSFIRPPRCSLIFLHSSSV